MGKVNEGISYILVGRSSIEGIIGEKKIFFIPFALRLSISLYKTLVTPS
jgi:hypothetical protein